MEENYECFWDCGEIDTTNLAVCVAGDMLKGKIDPLLYLSERVDFEKLNYMRFCLALDIDENYLADKTADQLKEIFEEECMDKFGENSVREPLSLAIILESLFGYFNKGITADYFISHDSLNGSYPTDKEKLAEMLGEHFHLFHSINPEN